MFLNTNTILLIATFFLLLAVAFVDVLRKYLDCKHTLQKSKPILLDSVYYQRLFYKYYNKQNNRAFLVHDNKPYLPFDKVKYKSNVDEVEREGIIMLKIVNKEPVLYIQDFHIGDDQFEISDLTFLCIDNPDDTSANKR